MVRTETTLALAVAALIVGSAGMASAGSSNTIYVIQESKTGAGNTLTVDQSEANGSLVGGLGSSGMAPAIQRGDHNEATLTIKGDGGVIRLLQDSFDASGTGNAAVVAVTGPATARVSQVGGANEAALTVTGALAAGVINQNGALNNASLTVDGVGANGSITQNGINNVTALEVLGAGTSVDYTVTGNNTTNVPNGGVQVFSNGASITITQTPVVPISR